MSHVGTRPRSPGIRVAIAAAILAAALVVAIVSGGFGGEAFAAPEIPAGAELKGSNAKKKPGKREVIVVGNNWEGTVDVIIPRGKFRRIARINVVPDIEERLAEIATDPVRLGYFLGIRELIGEGNDQLVDDVYTSNDGRLLVVSRPSLRDVVAIELATGAIKWRFVVDGQRSDHMAISPDGEHVTVSASTGNVVHILDIKSGAEVGQFESGDTPHETYYSADGSRIYHASIGLVYTPADQPQFDSSKGDRYFQIVDAHTNQILERVDMGEKLAEAGHPGMSSAVRPIAVTDDETKVYLQVSFFHGFVEYDLTTDEVARVVELPNLNPDLPREAYILDSAHHGIALSGNEKKVCVAGTMSDYAAIVSLKSLKYKMLKEGTRPYWSTSSSNGRRCYVAQSNSDSISVISYRTAKEIRHIEVGNHPQRIRNGFVRKSFVAANR